jgi:hypothetical protein
MGGLGSGRKIHFDVKNTVSDYLSIDIRKWCRGGLLTPGTQFNATWSHHGVACGFIQAVSKEKCVILTYRYRSDDDWVNMHYAVDIEWTNCHFGGKRAWFLCPAGYCNRRTAILYGGEVFACRHCYQLAYPSQREGMGDRAARKAEKIRERLDWEPGILNGEGLKPKGMHWKKFELLRREHERLVNTSIREATLRFGIHLLDLL